MHAVRAILVIFALVLALMTAVWADEAPSAGCTIKATPTSNGPNMCMGQDSVSIAAVGDVLLHGALQRTAYRQSDGFQALWRDIIPYLKAADIAYANLEGPTAPGINKSLRQRRDPGLRYDNDVYSSYPLFNYHPRLIDDLKQSGFDIVSTANNHALDRGSKGANLTIDLLNQAGLTFSGTIKPDSPRKFVGYVPSKLGQIAFIACSYSTNGLRDRHHQVLLCYQDREELLKIVRAQAADPSVAAIIVTPHWGNEYQHRPNKRQKELARALIEAGATAIIGTHAHVVQVWDVASSSQFDQRAVIYATGNFVSGQVRFPRRVGALAWLELCRKQIDMDLGAGLEQKLQLGHLGWMPLLMQRTARGPKLTPVVGDGLKGEFKAAHRLMAKYVPASEIQFDHTCTEAN